MAKDNKQRTKHSYLTPKNQKNLRRCKAMHGKNSAKCDKYKSSNSTKKKK